MNKTQSGMIIGARLVLVIGGVVVFFAGAAVGGDLAVALMITGAAILVIWCVVSVRTSRMIRNSTQQTIVKPSTSDQGTQ